MKNSPVYLFLRKKANFLKYYYTYKIRINLTILIVVFLSIIVGGFYIYGYFNLSNINKYKKKLDIKSIEFEIQKASVKFNEEIKDMDNITSFIYEKYFSSVKGFTIYKYSEESFKTFDKNVLDAIFQLNRDVPGFTILTKTGATFSYYNPFSPYYYNSNKEKYLRNIDSNKERINNIILNYANYENYGEYIQCIKQFDRNSHLIGMIVVEKNIGRIEKWLSDFIITQQGVLMVVNEDNEIIYTNNDINILNNYLKQSNIQQKLKDSAGRMVTQFNEEEQYLFYDKSVYYGCNLIVLLPEKIIGQSFPVRFYVLNSSILLFIAVITVLVLFRNMIIKPISKIEKAIEKISKGELSHEIKNVDSKELHDVTVSINKVMKNFQDLIEKEYTSNLLKKQAELNALQSQINPHFLYNTLESIRGYALYEGVDHVADMADALSRLFKYSISKKNNLVTFKEELLNVDNYLTIQKYCYYDRLELIKEIDQDTLNYMIPKLCIQPIIENSIKHGLETKMGMGVITISAYATQKRLIISIEDNGIGIKDEELNIINNKLQKNKEDIIINIENKEHTSIGIENVNERIKLYFGDDYGIRIYSTYNIGTIVEIVLPLINNKEYKSFFKKHFNN